MSGSFESDNTIADLDLSMQSAILYGLEQPMENVFQQGSFSCPTGNCTWPPFESLAICNRCTDVAGSLQSIFSSGDQVGPFFNLVAHGTRLPHSGTAFRLPNGLYLDNQNGSQYNFTSGFGTTSNNIIAMATLGTSNATETISAHDLDTLIWSMSMIRLRPVASTTAWPDLPLSAMECALFYCVNSYEFKMSSGTLTATSEQVLGAKRVANSWEAGGDKKPLNESTLESIAFQENYSVIPRTDLMLASPATGRRFNLSKKAIDSTSYFFQSKFATKRFNEYMSDSKKGSFNGYYVVHPLKKYEPSIIQALFASPDINETFTTLAASMSNAIRTGADETFDGIPLVLTGSKGELITFYRVVWPWISLHAFIVVTGVVFLLLTIRENKRHGMMVPLWKSSSLAMLNRGQEVAGILSGIQTVEQMEAVSKTSRVILLDKKAEASSLEHLAFDPLEVES